MKILELRQSLRHGNLERLIVGTAAELRPRGFEVDILLLYNRNRAHPLDQDESQLPEIHPLIADAKREGVTAWQEIDPSPLSPQLLLAILRQMRRRKYDLLHSHDVKTDVLGLLAGRLAGVPVVATAHGYPSTFRRSGVYRRLDLLALRLCRHIICVSEGFQQELLAAGLEPRRLSVIRNGIAVADMVQKASAGRQTLRHDLGLEPDDVIVMAMGRLSPEKGHIYLLQAARLLVQQGVKVRVVIVGEGPLKEELAGEAKRLGIEKHVFLLGFRADIPALIAQCDLSVLPSLSEPLGNVILEAMALGKPVIGTTAGGIAEMIVNAETGLLVPPADAEALEAAVRQLLDNPQQARSLGERGRERVLSEFTVERMADRLAAVFTAAAQDGAHQGKNGH
jgi:glycosyltransferase involved in cell wall biosynthesis